CKYNGLNESNNLISEDEASIYEYDVDFIQTYAVDLIETMIDKIPIKFELDTGSGISVIGSQTWEALGRPNLQETHRVAQAYGGQLLRFRDV
ncbi:hypothetical protein PMAYCL1PPCAC_24899, partial [Pristionchus mayeri]